MINLFLLSALAAVSTGNSTVIINNTNTNSTEVRTNVSTEVSGENASARSEITNSINGEETKIVVDKPGKVEVTTKNGETKVTTVDITPTIIVRQSTAVIYGYTENQTKQIVEEINKVHSKFSRFFSAFFKKLFSFHFSNKLDN